MSFDGCLLVDKPSGPTSFDIVHRVRRILGTRKVGHTGTLDPNASGLLPIVVGEGTKLARFLSLETKAYDFTMVLGAETESHDTERPVVATGDPSTVDVEDIEAILDEYTGEIMQVPPRFSAIKIDGRRAYDLAREGVDFELEPRPVRVDELRLERLEGDRAHMHVQCGSGTYVRALTRDIGRQLGCYAHAVDIRRTRVGPFTLERARSPERLEEGNPREALLSPAEMLVALPKLEVGDDEATALRYGQFLTREVEGVAVGEHLAAIDTEGELVAVVRPVEIREDGVARLKPDRVLAERSEP